ncbi:MAG: hypothetical protein VB013_14135 [Anaerolineaceae bacterium]|nr:hypothetical protein [Anaerolineaceae bacterium]
MNTDKNSKIIEPPNLLDGADVLFWAYEPQKPFFIMNKSDGTPYKPIHGIAICRYPGENQFYKFSCDVEWNVENDWACDSLEEALKSANDQSTLPIFWNKK